MAFGFGAVSVGEKLSQAGGGVGPFDPDFQLVGIGGVDAGLLGC
jgi:hypothetical protein